MSIQEPLFGGFPAQ